MKVSLDSCPINLFPFPFTVDTKLFESGLMFKIVLYTPGPGLDEGSVMNRFSLLLITLTL